MPVGTWTTGDPPAGLDATMAIPATAARAIAATAAQSGPPERRLPAAGGMASGWIHVVSSSVPGSGPVRAGDAGIWKIGLGRPKTTAHSPASGRSAGSQAVICSRIREMPRGSP